MTDAELIEEHLRVYEVAARLHVSQNTVRRMFRHHPHTKFFGRSQGTRQQRKYETMLIPISAVEEECAKLEKNRR